MNICPTCSKPISSSIQDVTFHAGKWANFTETLRLEAIYCQTPNCFVEVRVLSHSSCQRHDFINAVAKALIDLRPILTGTIERSRAVSTYDFTKGMRKTKMKDAKEITGLVIHRLEAALKKFTFPL